MDFWERLKLQITLRHTTQKRIAGGIEVSYGTFRKWLDNKTYPDVRKGVLTAKLLETTAEELVEGEQGKEYVRRLLAKEGGLWEPPENIREIVSVIQNLSETDLKVVKKMLAGLRYEYEASSPVAFETTETEPEYASPVVSIKDYLPKTEKLENVRFVDWDIVMLPFYGKTAAGIPIDMTITPGYAVPYPRQKLKGKEEEHYVVQVQGTSMTEAGIQDGDYAIIRHTEKAQDGKIMLVRHESESTLKRIRIKKDKVYLHWEDGSKKKKLVDSSEYEIQGEYIGALRG
jgi:SOS-response transcriptional repressor LexA